MAEVKSHEFDAFVKRKPLPVRLFLIYGPDRGLVSERAAALAAASGVDLTDAFSVVKLDAGEIGSQPGRLMDEMNAIGLFGGVPFTSTRYQLAPGDMLVLATDGITEAFAPDRSMFGTERFEQELAAMAELKAKDVSDRLVSAVQRFAATAPQSDDISCVVVRYLG